MKVTRLQRARLYRIFRDFTWPSTLPDFGQFNVIYGWNGAGKTAFSNIFRHIQSRTAMDEGQVEILVDETRVQGAAFSHAALPQVRTFNRDTIDRNVFETSSQQFPPVYYLGEDSVEKQKRIEALKADLAQHTEAEVRWNRSRQDATSTLDAFCSEEAKAIKNLLTVAGGGPYNNYNATNFKIQISALAQQPESSLIQLSESDRESLLAMKDGRRMEAIPILTGSFPDVMQLTSLTQTTLERSVVSAVLAELTADVDVAAWVERGLELHRGEHATDTCRFCEGPLKEERVRRLDEHFNDEFRRFQADVDGLIVQVQAAREFEREIVVPPKEAIYPNLRPGYEKAVTTMRQQMGSAQLFLDVLLRALKAKKDEPFRSLRLDHFVTNATATGGPAGGFEKFLQLFVGGAAMLGAASGKTAFDQLAAIVVEHNKQTADFDVELAKARRTLGDNELVKSIPSWKKKSKAVSDATESMVTASARVKELVQEIGELERLVRQHRRPAEELNQEIAAYLGRDELRFSVEQNGYLITRSGAPATHLSEGERTAIAFLYFLKSLRATDFDLERGVVVIDDPVSSLDANSLFSAFGFMKQRTLGVGQLFVLTHNFTFFRQVRNWFYNLPGQRKKDEGQRPARFYMLISDYSNGVRSAKLESLDRFLHEYESEYHYLFKRVYEEANKAVIPAIEGYYAAPNIARRLLEAFLAFRLPHIPGELYTKLEQLNYDTSKKTRILRFLHTYSHSDQVTESDHDPSVLAETPAVLKEVLDLIRQTDSSHYLNMESLITSKGA